MLVNLLLFLGISVGFNLAMFVVAFRARTDKLTDISYAASFLFLAWLGLLASELSLHQVLLVAMVTLWALRLGGFLWVRIRHMGWDARFDAIRGDFWKFARFWLGQGVTVAVLLLPVLFALAGGGSVVSPLALGGLAVWALGLSLEAVADLQKYRFNQQKAHHGQWIDRGLWRYSRHPNYFGEMLVWVGLYLCALPALGTVQAVVGLASPLFIILLLLFVSGLPPLEKAADARWGSDPRYQAYKRSTSVLVPLPKKR